MLINLQGESFMINPINALPYPWNLIIASSIFVIECLVALTLIIFCIYYLKKFWRFRNKKFETLDRFDRANIFDWLERLRSKESPQYFLRHLKAQLIALLLSLFFIIGMCTAIVLYLMKDIYY